MIPENLTKEESEKAVEDLLAFRFKLLQKQSENERIYSDLLRLKYQIAQKRTHYFSFFFPLLKEAKARAKISN